MELEIRFKGVLLQDWDGIFIGNWDITQEPVIVPKSDIEEDEPKDTE